MTRLLRSGRSLTARLALLFALVSIVVLTAAGVYLDQQLSTEFARHDDVELRGKIDLVAHVVAEFGLQRLLNEERERLVDLVAGHPRLRLGFYDATGKLIVVIGDRHLPAELGELVTSLLARPALNRHLVESGDGMNRLGIARLKDSSAVASGFVALALDTREQRAMHRAFRGSLAVTVAVSAVAAAIGGLLVALRGLRPLQAITRTAQSVRASHLSERIRLDNIPSELQPLAASFNEMLARLEDSFVRLSEFSSDLAHELRTPINTLIGQTQVTLGKSRSSDEYHQLLDSNLEELERLSRMTEEMLFLARADQGQQALKRGSLKLSAELQPVIEFYEALLAERGLRVQLCGDAVVDADRALVRRAVSNLLSNAIRYSPAGSTIRIGIDRLVDGGIALSITNPGEGIDPKHLNRVFDRFFRTDIARNSGGEGSGLGLAIVKSIAELHGGRVDVASTPDKETSFRMIFPAA